MPSHECNNAECLKVWCTLCFPGHAGPSCPTCKRSTSAVSNTNVSGDVGRIRTVSERITPYHGPNKPHVVFNCHRCKVPHKDRGYASCEYGHNHHLCSKCVGNITDTDWAVLLKKPQKYKCPVCNLSCPCAVCVRKNSSVQQQVKVAVQKRQAKAVPIAGAEHLGDLGRPRSVAERVTPFVSAEEQEERKRRNQELVFPNCHRCKVPHKDRGYASCENGHNHHLCSKCVGNITDTDWAVLLKKPQKYKCPVCNLSCPCAACVRKNSSNATESFSKPASKPSAKPVSRPIAKQTTNDDSFVWWRGLESHNGQEVVCNGLMGYLAYAVDPKHPSKSCWGIKCLSGKTMSPQEFEESSGSRWKRPKKSIRFVSTNLTLEEAAQFSAEPLQRHSFKRITPAAGGCWHTFGAACVGLKRLCAGHSRRPATKAGAANRCCWQCDVCGHGTNSANGRIPEDWVECTACHTKVHFECYSEINDFDKPMPSKWLCDRCTVSTDGNLCCSICGSAEGALKKNHSVWTHIRCQSAVRASHTGAACSLDCLSAGYL